MRAVPCELVRLVVLLVSNTVAVAFVVPNIVAVLSVVLNTVAVGLLVSNIVEVLRLVANTELVE